ncbi:MAG: hypothetical protein HY815_18850 [Candidatus Riflebacteria bacterium]|nr:hypothetical protein [Candidatus Riflebacteria bacterium]
MSEKDRIWQDFNLDENCVHVADSNQVRLYFAQFTLALRALTGVLEKTVGKSNGEAQAVNGYVARPSRTFHLLGLKYFYERPGEGLKVDSTDSGFFHFSTLVELEADLAGRDRALAELEPVADLKRQMADRIVHRRSSPRDLQEQIARRLYLETLKPSGIFRSFVPGPLVSTGEPGPDRGGRAYLWSFATYDQALNRPFVYLLYFTYNLNMGLATGSADFDLLVKQAQKLASGRLNLLAFSGMMGDGLESFSLKIVKRIILGPYWSPVFTENEGELGALLEGFRARFPFILRWEAETLISDKEMVVGQGLLSRGRLKQVFWIPKNADLSARGVSHLGRFVLVPYWLGQHLARAGLFRDHQQFVIDKEDLVYGVH